MHEKTSQSCKNCDINNERDKYILRRGSNNVSGESIQWNDVVNLGFEGQFSN